MILYRNKLLFKTTLHVGHEQIKTESYNNYYYSGVSKNIVFFKFKHIIYSLLRLKACLNLVKNEPHPFLFVLGFNEISQYLLSSKVVETKLSFSKSIHQVNLVLEPTGGFLASRAARYLKQQIFETPLFFSFSRTIILSFGDDTLPIMLKEAMSKNVLFFSIVDSNQKRVSTGVDYIIPGNDDSVASSYFIVLFFFNIVLF